MYVENGIDIARECECRAKTILSNRLKFANIPEAFKDMTMDNFNFEIYSAGENKLEIGIACKSITYYLENFDALQEKGLGLYIWSEKKGSGKTRMAASISNKLLANHQVKFVVSADILKEIKATWDKDSESTESRLIDDLCNAEILVIDDFGIEKASEWVNQIFYQIINTRYVNKKIVIFTSNDSLENSKYNDRITNRILERTFDIHFPEQSIREKISKENNDNLLKKIKEK